MTRNAEFGSTPPSGRAGHRNAESRMSLSEPENSATESDANEQKRTGTDRPRSSACAALGRRLQQAESTRPAQQGCAVVQERPYEEAIEHFKNAVNLDPSLINARLYLATAYAQQYIPEPTRRQQALRRAGHRRIQRSAGHVNPPKEQQFQPQGHRFPLLQHEEVRRTQAVLPEGRRLDPNDPETYYSIAVIDWTQAYTSRAG